MLTTLIVFILSLSFLVFVHELGHFTAARLVGVRVLEFSIGFPPKAWGKVIGETEYMLSWIPLGGFVRLKGLDTEEEASGDPDSYTSKTPLQQLFVLLAGPVMNLVLAFLLMPLVFMMGLERPQYLEQPPLIWQATPDTPAWKAGLQKGDLIVSIAGQGVQNFQEAHEAFFAHKGEKVELRVRRGKALVPLQMNLIGLPDSGSPGWLPWMEARAGAVTPGSPAALAGIEKGDLILRFQNQSLTSWYELTPFIQEGAGAPIRLLLKKTSGETQEVMVAPSFSETRKIWYIGIAPPSTKNSVPFVQAIGQGVNRVLDLGQKTFHFVFRLFSGKAGSDSIGGPIMIAQVMGQAAKNGMSDLLELLSFISLQLGIFNLFPIPALDGGHILLLAIERVKGSPLSSAWKNRVTRTGFLLLLFLILLVSVQDSLRLFK